MEVTVISYPLNEINYTVNLSNTYISGEIVQNIWVNVSDAPTDEYIEISYNGVIKTLIITEECRYTPIDIAFQNKNGALQILTFFKAKKDTINIEREIFESNRAIGAHQFVPYNVNSKSKFTVNSGFMTEDKNGSIKELLESERVWMLDAGVEIPINVSTASLEYKTRQNDKLINYAIEFDYAYYDINNV